MDQTPLIYFPTDILTDILSRLPAKSLLRFKSVSISWYNLINGSHFIKFHLNRSLTTKSNIYFVFQNPNLRIGDFDTFENSVEINYPFKKPDSVIAFITGNCNGLLCIRDYSCYHNFVVAVYNPTTRTHKYVPCLLEPPHCGHIYPTSLSGFGYDCVFDDYKIVRIFHCYGKNDIFCYSEVMVYSMRNDAWVKVFDHVPYKFSCRCVYGVYLNGCLHWVSDSKMDHPPLPIIGFNISTNSFFEVLVPEIDLYLYTYMHVGVLDECLCIVVNYLDEHEIWIMKEYGVVESWTKLYRVYKARQFDAMEGPVGFTIDRKVLLVRLCLHRVSKLDLETMEVENVEVSCNRFRRWDAHICVENLLVLDYFTEIFEEEDHGTSRGKTRKKKKGKKKRRMRN